MGSTPVRSRAACKELRSAATESEFAAAAARLREADLLVVRLQLVVAPTGRQAVAELRVRSSLAVTTALRLAGKALPPADAKARASFARDGVASAQTWASALRAKGLGRLLRGKLMRLVRGSASGADFAALLLEAGAETAPDVRSVLLVLTAESLLQQCVVEREAGKCAEADRSIEKAAQLVRQAAEELRARGGSEDLELLELADTIAANQEFVKGTVQIEAAHRMLARATSGAEELDVESVYDALDLCVDLARHSSDVEIQARACCVASYIHFKVLKSFAIDGKSEDRAFYYASEANHRASASPSGFLGKPWFAVTLELLKLKQRKVREADESKQKQQDELDKPLKRELEPALALIDAAHGKSWEAFLQHIYAAHPVKGRKLPANLSPDNQRKCLLSAQQAYHPDKVQSKNDRKLLLLHGYICAKINHFFNQSKGC